MFAETLEVCFEATRLNAGWQQASLSCSLISWSQSSLVLLHNHPDTFTVRHNHLSLPSCLFFSSCKHPKCALCLPTSVLRHHIRKVGLTAGGGEEPPALTSAASELQKYYRRKNKSTVGFGSQMTPDSFSSCITPCMSVTSPPTLSADLWSDLRLST